MAVKRHKRSGSHTAEAKNASTRAAVAPKSSSKRQKKKQHGSTNETSPASAQVDAISGSLNASESKRKATQTKSSTQNEIATFISKFISATKTSTSEKECTDLDSVISYLIQFLQKNTASSVNDGHYEQQQSLPAAISITKEDVATLLLPWSVSRLMRLTATSTIDITEFDEMDSLAWVAISSSLDAVSATSLVTSALPSNDSSSSQIISASKETLLATCFPQSTLNRLVPYAGRIAFSSASSSNQAGVIKESASKTFVHLVRRYKSSFDVTCKTLLGDADTLLSTTMTDNDTSLTTHEVAVVRATLEKIYGLMENANPKRLFTIVSSIDVLPRLGRLSMVSSSSSDDVVKNWIEKILWDGLFNPVHHMDGFRTMNEMKDVPKVEAEATADKGEENEKKKKEKRNSKTCFQAGLFQSVKPLFSTPVDESGKDVIATAKIMPRIVNGFFERVQEHAMQSKKNGGTTTEADAKLQFRFWCNLILPVLDALFGMKQDGNENLKSALLDTISQTLGLVLQYDAYLPSYNDPDEEHLSFLQSVANGLLRCVNDSSDKETELHHGNITLVTSLRNLILLNHRLLQGQLSIVTNYACSCSPQKNQEPNKLLFTITKTYRELRAIGDFLTATREAFTNGSTKSNDAMSNMLSCNNVVDSLALAYQSCPSGQLQEIWNFFDSWIVDIISSTTELSFAVQMFIVFIKSVRADKQNSLSLRGLCESSMNSSISKLLDRKDSESIRMRLGFDLCGWLVDLHSRSCFWIDNVSTEEDSSFLIATSEDDKDSLNVLTYLHDAAETTVTSKKFSSWKESFIESYWQNPTDNAVVDIGVHFSMRGSLQRLALHRIHQLHSMIYYCNLEESKNDSMDSQSAALTQEAKMLVDFSFYIACSETIGSNCEESTSLSESLWIPIARSSPIWSHYSDGFHSELFLIWFYTSLTNTVSVENEYSSHTSRREYATSIALTRDASFYDNINIMSPLIQVGIKFAANNFNRDTEVSSKVLSFISSAPVEIIECFDSTKILEEFLELDIQSADSLRLSQNETFAKILCSTRYIMARMLSIAVLPSSFDISLFTRLIEHLLSSTEAFGDDKNYLSASSDAINEYLSMCIDYYEKEDALLDDFFSQLSSQYDSTSKISSSMAFLLRGIIRKLSTLNRHRSLSKRSAARSKSVHDICTENVLAIHKCTWECIFDKISVSNSSSSVELLLASELLSFQASCSVESASTKENTTKLFERVAIMQRSSQGVDMTAACNYCLSIMSSTPDFLFECVAKEKVFEQIIDAMTLTDTPILDAAFCSLIRHTNVDGLDAAIRFLTNKTGKEHNPAFIVRTFHLMTSTIKSQEQQKYMAGYCRHFLLISMDILREEACDGHQTKHHADLFSKMMTTLLARKELLVLSGREIGMVCGEMTRLFHIEGANKRDIECDISVFNSCCSVVSALMGHYSKQLYGCPSTLFGLLLSLLSNVLQTNAKNGLTEKALEYSKLCELLIPHKELFKKHVVGLILCYIKALSEGMSPSTKKKLMPSIYALLDVCSEYETRQINAMIDVPSKALFAPVFRSYQKFYQYRGQA